MRKRGPRYEKRRKSASALVTRLPKPVVQKQTTRWRHWKSRERDLSQQFNMKNQIMYDFIR